MNCVGKKSANRKASRDKGFFSNSKNAIFALLLIAAALSVYGVVEAAVVSHQGSEIVGQVSSAAYAEDSGLLQGLTAADILEAGGGGGGVGGLEFNESTNTIEPASVHKTVGTVVDNLYGKNSLDEALEIGNDGFARMAYEGNNQNPYYVRCLNANCSQNVKTKIASVTVYATAVSLKVGSDGYARIAYVSNDKLYFVRCTNDDCTTKVGPIQKSADGSNDKIRSFSMALSAADLPNFAVQEYDPDYGDSGRYELYWLSCNDIDCSDSNYRWVYFLDSFSASDVSAKVAPDGTGRIAYKESPYVYYVHCKNLLCMDKVKNLVSLETTYLIRVSLAVDASGFGRIAYAVWHPNYRGDIFYARCLDSDCASKNIELIDSGAGYISHPSIRLGSDGFARIAYHKATLATSDLYFVRCLDADCTAKNITLVESYGNIAGTPSLTLTTENYPRIAYTTEYNVNKWMFYTTNAQDPPALSPEGVNFGSPEKPFRNVFAEKYYGKSTTISAFDVAEEYPVLDSSIEPGDIVAISSKGLAVGKSAMPYQSSLLGVVSTEPGLALANWEKSDSTRLISLVGRTPVKVSTENGNIAAGDPITSSSAAGVGMKATKTGKIVGYALEDFNSKEGKIMLFINVGFYVPEQNR